MILVIKFLFTEFLNRIRAYCRFTNLIRDERLSVNHTLISHYWLSRQYINVLKLSTFRVGAGRERERELGRPAGGGVGKLDGVCKGESIHCHIPLEGSNTIFIISQTKKKLECKHLIAPEVTDHLPAIDSFLKRFIPSQISANHVCMYSLWAQNHCIE